MASDNQVALSRSYRGAAPNLSKAARQVVPQFLQKLYEMVNDPNNNELIRWADSGDSFFVLDHERFAREVLGRWFKHQNFASFVRQLNMYGFHKIPHLQQGVLKSESDIELWNFEHPHFHRGQPDLLCLIQRKKQAPQGGAAEDVVPDNKDAAQASTTHPTNAQILDINSIINGIAAVKRHQQTISADLNELKNSNQHLWQEALAARERHKSHQDTINRILKFLASVFGRTNAHDNKDHGAHSPPQPMVSRKRQRLMIADGSNHKTRTPSQEDDSADDDQKSSDSSRFDDITKSPKDPYATIETPSANSPSTRSNDTFSPVISTASYFPEHQPSRQSQQLWNGRQTPTPSTSFTPPKDSALELHRPSSTQPNVSLSMPQPALPPSTSSSSAVHTQTPQSQDAVLQAAFQQLMHSPSQMQRFMQALSSTQGFPQTPLPPPAYPPPLQQQQQYSQIAPYDPPEDYSSMLPPDSVASAQALLPKVDDGPPLSPLMDSSARLQKSYKDSSEIDADVDALQASINSLIEGMGMDPGTLSAAQPSSQMLPSSSLDMSADTELAPEDAQAADFDLDAFLTQFASGPGAGAADADITGGGGVHDADGNVDRMHAFMDEVASDPSTPATHGSPDTHGRPSAKSQAQAVAAAATHRKRKSDVAELAQELPLSTPEPAPPQSQPPRAKRAKK